MPVVVKLCLTFQCLRREANPDPAATWFCLLSALANWSLVWPWQDIGSPATSKATGANSAAGKKSSMQNGQLTLIIHEVVGGEPGAYGNAQGQHQESTGTAHLPGAQGMCRKALTLQNTISPPNSPGIFQPGRSSEKAPVQVCSEASQIWTFSVVLIGVTARKEHFLTALNSSELGLQWDITPV